MLTTRLVNVDPPPDAAHPWPDKEASFTTRGTWPAHWIHHPDAVGREPVVAAYRLRFTVDAAGPVVIHASADERFDLFLDGERIGRGPERGTPERWYWETYRLELAPGPHVLVARVWSLGVTHAPWAHLRLAHGFILAPQEQAWVAILATGVAGWDGRILPGHGFAGGTGAAWHSSDVIDGPAYAWGFERGEGEFQSVVKGPVGRTARASAFVHTFEHGLHPPRLPALRHAVRELMGTIRHIDAPLDAVPVREAQHRTDELAAWQALLAGGAPIVLPRRTRRRVLIDLDDYVNGYPLVRLSGGRGSELRWGWAESLRSEPRRDAAKGRRDQCEGKWFVGPDDIFRADGGCGRSFSTLWWRAGRWLQILVTTADEPLTIERLAIEETGYPFHEDGAAGGSDPRLAPLMERCLRTLACCQHDTFMDCPFYEQQMWVGDLRVQALASLVIARDDRLVRRCLEYIGLGRMQERIVPGRHPAPQWLWMPSFSLAWCNMLHDHALWRGDRVLTNRLMPALRGTLDELWWQRDANGLVEADGWLYTDWAVNGDWKNGEPPGPTILSWWMVMALEQAAVMEQWLGETHLMRHHHQRARILAEVLLQRCWDGVRGLFTDGPGLPSCSEHAQALAVLSGHLPAVLSGRLARTLPETAGLTRTSYYFDHYLFEALRRLDRHDVIWQRMESYFAFAEQGLLTTPETADPRSDCHGWSAHPRYHLVATMAGIRPSGFGFSTVDIQPQPGPLEAIQAAVPHPAGGLVRLDLRKEHRRWTGTVELPAGVHGRFRLGSHNKVLEPGMQQV